MKTKFNYPLLFISFGALSLVFINESALKAFCIIVFSFIYGGIAVRIDKSLSDPRVIFIPFIGIYQSFYALQVLIIPAHILPLDLDILSRSLDISILFMFLVMLVFSTIKSPTDHIRQNPSDNLPFKLSENVQVLAITVLCSIVFLIGFSSGASNKRELMYTEGSGAIQTIALFSLFYLSFLFQRAFIEGRRKMIGGWLSLFLVLCLLSAFIQGERDPIFRVVFLILIFYFLFYSKLTIPKFIAFFLCVTVIVPFSQLLKGIFLSGSFDASGFQLYSILGNEFISSGRNLYSILLYSDNVLKPELLLNDVFRGILPKFITGNSFSSGTYWFNHLFRIEHGFSGSSGWGFTIIGEFFAALGLAGVTLLGIVFSFILKKLYEMSMGGSISLSFYTMFLITSIYILRADLATLLAQGIKLPLFCFITHLFIKFIFKK